MVEVGPTAEQLIAAALAASRAAGLSEAEIGSVLREEAAIDDGFTPVIVAGRLFALAREARRVREG